MIEFKGTLLEVCDCRVLCPCWTDKYPDNGTCQSALAYRIDKGAIDGVDVSGLTVAGAAFIPGRPLYGNIRVIRFIDDRAMPEQEAALLAAFRGEHRPARLVGRDCACRDRHALAVSARSPETIDTNWPVARHPPEALHA